MREKETKMRPILRGKRPLGSTSLLYCILCVLSIVVGFTQESNGFQPIGTSKSMKANRQGDRDFSPLSRMNAVIIDHADIPIILTTTHQAADQITSALMSSQHSIAHLPINSLPTVLTSSLDLFGAHADILATGKSIAPSVEAMTKMGHTYSGTSAGASLQQIFPNGGEALQTKSQEAISYGYNVMNGVNIVKGGGASLPGFTETRSILAPHLIPGPAEESITTPGLIPEPYMFKARLSYVTSFLRVIEQLPYVAFAYALVEFFFLRSDVDIYKEDIEDDPVGVLAETVSDVGVRIGIFSILATITYIIV
mmetsp:Transcript_33789/g.36424  ORF Transcript_33789/g.36424 Transcript_33789/m.36424 type:complete len:310 (-) Transcript_33789:199-1128(-)